ncbi:MAG: hypothetical protein EON89_11475 [Brevundimonas sp.]|nr:MAG: hypothetical protein EON89_11475 [Brevundimonas sp.]
MTDVHSPPPPRKRAAWPPWAPRATLEAGLIVFSVILALAATNWVEERRTADRVHDMRGFLAAEMRQNRATLSEPTYLPHHTDLKQKFFLASGRQADAVDPEATRVAMQTLFASGLHPPQLKDAVWTSVSQGDLIEHMKPEDVFALAEVYKAQSALEDWSVNGATAAVDLLDMLDNPATAKLRLVRMTMFLEDMTSQERRLIDLYDQALARLDPDGRSATPAKGDAAPPKG